MYKRLRVILVITLVLVLGLVTTLVPTSYVKAASMPEESGSEIEEIEEREETINAPETEQLIGMFQSIKAEYDGTEVLKVDGKDITRFVTNSVVCELDKYSNGAITITTSDQSLKIIPQGIGFWNVGSAELEYVEENKAIYRNIY